MTGAKAREGSSVVGNTGLTAVALLSLPGDLTCAHPISFREV